MKIGLERVYNKIKTFMFMYGILRDLWWCKVAHEHEGQCVGLIVALSSTFDLAFDLMILHPAPAFDLDYTGPQFNGDNKS